MKPLIILKGDWQDAYATVYIHPKYKKENATNHYDYEAVCDDGYNCVVSMDDGCKNLNLRIALAPRYEDRSFIFVYIQKPTQIFDKDKVESNVPIEVRRSHSMFGWIIHFVALTLYGIKKLFR